jgi:hypothetical protein
MEDSQKEREEKFIFDRLLNKYVAVWLWSIIFGATTGVIYSFLNFRTDRWGWFGLLMLIPIILAFLAYLLSSHRLYKALKCYLLPKFFLPSFIDNEENSILFIDYIKQSFYFFIVAVSFRLLISILEIIFGALGSFGSFG